MIISLSLKLIFLNLFNVIYCNKCNKQVQVKLLHYDKKVINFHESFSIVNQYGQKLSLKLTQNNSESPINVTLANDGVKLDTIIKSINRRKVESAFTDDNQYYFALVDNSESGEPKKEIIKIKHDPGNEDPDPDEVNESNDQLFSVKLFYPKSQLTYSYVISNSTSSLSVKLMKNSRFKKSLSGYVDFLAKLSYLPQYIIPIDEIYCFVIYPNSSYSFHQIDFAVALDPYPITKAQGIEIHGSEDHISEVRALIRIPDSSDHFESFYIVDDDYHVYTVVIQGEEPDERTITAVRIEKPDQFSDLIDSIRIRTAKTISTNSLDYYYAVENFSENSVLRTKVSKYILFYGRNVKTDLWQLHRNTFHALLTQMSPDDRIYFSWFYESDKLFKVNLHSHLIGFQDSNSTEISNLNGSNWHKLAADAPLYIIPLSNNSKKVLTIYRDSKFTITSLEHALSLEKNNTELKPIPYENDCSKIKLPGLKRNKSPKVSFRMSERTRSHGSKRYKVNQLTLIVFSFSIILIVCVK